MALAETAELLVLLKLRDQLSAPLASVNQRIKETEATTGRAQIGGARLSGAFNAAGGAAGRFGGALSHAGSQLRNFAFGPLGLIGVTGGLLTFGGAIEKGIGRAQEFGGEVHKMSALTGLSIETTSALASAFDHFNIGADQAIRLTGFLEKNVGLLASRKGALADFEKTFGLALTDQNGKIKDANELILTTADYFTNKSIPATTKAAALAKIYGRSWQELIPFLSAGRQGIEDAEAEAAALGLTLTAKDIPALRAMKEATRTWGDALGGLELQIGLALLPSLTDLAKSATSFVRDNRTNIVQFFRNGAKFAGELGDAIGKYVVPAIKGIADAWGSLPEGVRQFLIGGAILGKTTKFLFDVGPLDIGKDFVGALAKAGLGKAFVQPVFVTNQALPGAAAAGGGVGGIKGILTFAAALGAATLAVELWQSKLVPLNDAIAKQTDDIKTQVDISLKSKSIPELLKEADALKQGFNDLSATVGGLGPLQDILYGSQKQALLSSVRAIQDEIEARRMVQLGDERNAQAAYLAFDRLEGAANPLSRTLDSLTSAAVLTRQQFLALYADAKAILAGRSFHFAIGKGEGPSRDLLTLADAITTKFENSDKGYFGDVRKQKWQLAALVKLQQEFKASGDTKSARAIGRDIERMKADLSQREKDVAAEIRRKKLQTSVKVGVTATAIATISAREGVKATATIYKYGSVNTGGGPVKIPT